MFLKLVFLKKKRVVGLQPIYRYDLCAARNIVYYLFPPQEVSLKIQL